MKNDIKTRMICEAAIFIALSIALSFFKIPLGVSFGGFGGSVDLVMIPIIIFSIRWGFFPGILCGFCFGTLKYFLANGLAVSLVSMFLDYSIAYAAVGSAGLFCMKGSENKIMSRNYKKLPLAAITACACRFGIHFISGITVYREYMPESFMNMTMKAPAIYSILYNGTYMLPNTILALAACSILIPVMKRIDS